MISFVVQLQLILSIDKEQSLSEVVLVSYQDFILEKSELKFLQLLIWMLLILDQSLLCPNLILSKVIVLTRSSGNCFKACIIAGVTTDAVLFGTLIAI